MYSDHFNYTPVTPNTTSHYRDKGQEQKSEYRPTGAL